MQAPNGTITQHLEGFLQSARKLEDALSEEKKRSQKIAQEYLATRTTLENAVRELQNRLMQRENKIQAITQAFHNLQATETSFKNEIRESTEREKKNTTELAQYKKAWNEVLAREAQARGSIIELEKAKAAINDQRNLVKALEQKLDATNQNAAIHSRHAETYQRELQSALIRIQSAESKYTQIQKEMAVLTQNKRNAEEEIARIETAMKERFRWEIANEKERLRAELEKDSALDRERFREVARNQMRAEIDRQVGADRQARTAVEAELAKIQATLTEAEAKRTQEVERSRARLLAVTEENSVLKEELNTLVATKNAEIESASARAERAERTLVATKNETAMYQLESNNSQMKIEMIRKDTSKAMLIERLRHDDEIRDLRAKIEQLVDSGIYAEKVDEVPEGMRVYSATSLSIARSNRDGNVADHVMNSEESNRL
jgi:chromosome segregation ATPase